MSKSDGETPRWFWVLLLALGGVAALFIGGAFGLKAFKNSARTRVNDYAASVAEEMARRLVPTEIVPRAHSLQPEYAIYFIGGPGRETIARPDADHPNLLRTSAGPAATEADIRTLAFVRSELHKPATDATDLTTYTLRVWVVDGTTREIVRYRSFPPPDNYRETNRPTFIVLVYDWIETLLRES